LRIALLLLLLSRLQVKVGDLTCDTLRPTLVGCGLQC
jgi:hypothetical protein